MGFAERLADSERVSGTLELAIAEITWKLRDWASSGGFNLPRGRREDDWTCPSCGNVNFSFRTTCNMHNCTQSRPSDHSSKSAPRLQTPPHFQSAGGYVGSASHYGGAPYGSSFYSGSPLPPYDLPAGGSGYPYAYGGRISVGSPYGPLHMSAPSPYSSGSMLGAGGIYGMPPVMDRYGMGMPMGHGPMGMPRPIVFPTDDFHKKPAGSGIVREADLGADLDGREEDSKTSLFEDGDTRGQEGPCDIGLAMRVPLGFCLLSPLPLLPHAGKRDKTLSLTFPQIQRAPILPFLFQQRLLPDRVTLNFWFPVSCFSLPPPPPLLLTPLSEGRTSTIAHHVVSEAASCGHIGLRKKPTVQEGSWKCPKCNNINYPFRTKCNRQHCGAERPSESNEPRGLTSDEDEQVCKCVAPDAFYSMLLFLYSKLSIDVMNNTPSDLFGRSVRFLIPVFLNFAHCLLHGLMFKYATVTVSPKNKLSGSRRFRVVFGVTLVSMVHSVFVVVTVVSLCTRGIQSPPVCRCAIVAHRH
ncbi:RanBP2-type zinc finger protein [Platanthera guangdongensis]|uniref:RanBP2-type zinc finger protein n=1 Tax=Platanthera guangdongensis TaxID=2320717 RepID=A0ABR2MTY0_9ASPA